jgi:hypothetical protein
MTNRFKYFTTYVILLALNCSTVYAGLNDAQVAFKSGNWKVLRSLDSMNDTVTCTGIYKENNGVQLTKDSLYVSVKGGLESVTLRFDDKPAQSMRLAEKMEKEVRAIIITGTDFSELSESSRLRIQALTLVRGVVNEDFNLTGIKDALESIRTSCPVQVNSTSENLEKTSSPVSESSPQPVCSDTIISRMKAQGLKEKQIRAICK